MAAGQGFEPQLPGPEEAPCPARATSREGISTAHPESVIVSSVLVYAVADLRSSPDHPRGDAVETFVRRENAERFVDEVRDDPELASYLRIEGAEARGGRAELKNSRSQHSGQKVRVADAVSCHTGRGQSALTTSSPDAAQWNP